EARDRAPRANVSDHFADRDRCVTAWNRRRREGRDAEGGPRRARASERNHRRRRIESAYTKSGVRERTRQYAAAASGFDDQAARGEVRNEMGSDVAREVAETGVVDVREIGRVHHAYYQS